MLLLQRYLLPSWKLAKRILAHAKDMEEVFLAQVLPTGCCVQTQFPPGGATEDRQIKKVTILLVWVDGLEIDCIGQVPCPIQDCASRANKLHLSLATHVLQMSLADEFDLGLLEQSSL